MLTKVVISHIVGFIMVAVAQFGRALDCGSGCRGFESHQPPHFDNTTFLLYGPLAQLVEQRTLNPFVQGSIP